MPTVARRAKAPPGFGQTGRGGARATGLVMDSRAYQRSLVCAVLAINKNGVPMPRAAHLGDGLDEGLGHAWGCRKAPRGTGASRIWPPRPRSAVAVSLQSQTTALKGQRPAGISRFGRAFGWEGQWFTRTRYGGFTNISRIDPVLRRPHGPKGRALLFRSPSGTRSRPHRLRQVRGPTKDAGEPGTRSRRTR